MSQVDDAAPAKAAAPAETAEPAEPVADSPPSAAPADPDGQSPGIAEVVDDATNEVSDQLGGGNGGATSIGRAQPAVGVFGNVEVAENETVELIVAVFGSYVHKGRSRGEAVVVFGDGEVLGPVERDCITVLGTVKVEAPIEGTLRVVLGKAYINSHVKGDVEAVMSEVEFGPNAVIDGERRYVGPQPKVHPSAVFNGPINPINIPGVPIWLVDYFRYGLVLGRPMVPSLVWCWFIVGFFFVFRLLLLLLFPKPIETGATILSERALRSFLIGVIAYVLYLPAQALLGATGVGLIAVPFIWLAFEIAGVLGKIALLRSLGGQVGRQLGLPALDTTLGGFIAGTGIVTVIYMVPVLGGIVFLLIKPMALGAMLIAAVEGFRRERPVPPNVPPPASPAQSAAPPVVGAAPTANLNSAVGASPSVSAAPKTANLPPVIGQPASRSNDFASDDLVSMTRVGFWPRLGATILDFVPIMIICGPMLHSGELFLLAWIAYHVGMWTWRGTTLGGIVFSLRVVRLDGRPLDFTVALVRALGSCLSFVVACLGFFWASWNPDKQSWHDMIAGTVIVKTPRSMPLV